MRISKRTHAYIPWLICVWLSGCVHIGNDRLLALAPLMQETVTTQASWYWWLWLFVVAAVLAWALALWRRVKRKFHGQDRPGQAAPLDREEMALYRTTRDSLSFLIKKRLQRTKLIHIDFLRKRNKNGDQGGATGR